jgi:hypothetical protein
MAVGIMMQHVAVQHQSPPPQPYIMQTQRLTNCTTMGAYTNCQTQ